jgi:DNA-binding FadR family transcriptional regulator
MEEIATFAAILDTSQHVSREHVAVVDRKFHQAIARAGENRVLAAALDLIFRDRDLLAMTMSFRKRRGALPPENGHRAIAEAIARRDPDEAEKALLRHLGYIIGEVEALAAERDDGGPKWLFGGRGPRREECQKIRPVRTLDKEEALS